MSVGAGASGFRLVLLWFAPPPCVSGQDEEEEDEDED